ncbi:cytochrome c-type biogenesis protein [Aliidiomarina quisquiliarum]|uniref:cytochrome c-type biogenesis protein n=1 Tax=Aliidiomarina quisquiliarum TaxID=2938947 RepID=UPI00208E9FF8|nr:cytochrome c-type biogenesis protein [Aliidiomarina quisquiliarum]MCO4321696.1 cytochrome c-type biogenesis protein CcmH [Aliidiomarina quisquiliarum]
MRILAFVLSILVSISILGAVQAQGEFYAFETAAQERLYNKLSKELRCPKCQNQSISDSDAPLAEDMRKKVHEMVLAGASYNEVVDFMKARYGDFVHYRPPVNASTIILWVGPLLVALIGMLFIFGLVRGQKKGDVVLTADEEAKLAAALNKHSQKGSN